MIAGGHIWPSWMNLGIASGGILILGEAIARLGRDVVHQKRWERVGATIRYLDVETRLRAGVRRCDIAAEYSYIYRGETFSCRTVSVLDSLPGLINGYPVALGMRLKSEYETKRTVMVLVDPADPSRAILLSLPLQGYVWLFSAILAFALLMGVLELVFRHPSSLSLVAGGMLGLGMYLLWHRFRKPSLSV